MDGNSFFVFCNCFSFSGFEIKWVLFSKFDSSCSVDGVRLNISMVLVFFNILVVVIGVHVTKMKKEGEEMGMGWWDSIFLSSALS